MDEINFEILADGTIKWWTTKISAANHVSAANLLADVEKLAGGTVKKESVPHTHAHEHHHQHQRQKA